MSKPLRLSIEDLKKLDKNDLIDVIKQLIMVVDKADEVIDNQKDLIESFKVSMNDWHDNYVPKGKVGDETRRI